MFASLLSSFSRNHWDIETSFCTLLPVLGHYLRRCLGASSVYGATPPETRELHTVNPSLGRARFPLCLHAMESPLEPPISPTRLAIYASSRWVLHCLIIPRRGQASVPLFLFFCPHAVAFHINRCLRLPPPLTRHPFFHFCATHTKSKMVS